MLDRLYSKRVNSPVLVCPPTREDNEKVIKELDIDQFSGQPFMRNNNGFISNDIMVFEQCQSDSVARAVLNRLKVLHPQSIDQNMTLEQMMASAIPANYGSPSEFVSAHKMIAEKMYKMYDADCKAYAARQAELASQRAAADAAAFAKQNKELEGSIPKSE